MKKLLLSLLVIGLGGILFADNVKKVPLPATSNKYDAQTEVKCVNAEKPASSVVEKRFNTKTDRVGDVSLNEISVVVNLPRSFGFGQQRNELRVSYNRDINTMALFNMFMVNEDIEDYGMNLINSYSNDGGNSFNTQILTSGGEDGVLTNWPNGLLFNPDRTADVSKAYAIGEGPAADPETSSFDSHFVASNFIGGDVEDTKYEVFREDEQAGVIGVKFPYGLYTSINPVDNSLWQLTPSFGGANGELDGLGVLKTKKENGEIKTTYSKIPFESHSAYYPFIMDWSPNGKYGVIGWIGYKPGISDFIDNLDASFEDEKCLPLFIFSSDYGKTWSDIQGVELCGPDGIEVIKEVYSGSPSVPDVENLYIDMTPAGFDVNVDKWGNVYFGGVMTAHPQAGTYFPASPYGIVYSTSEQAALDPESNIRNVREALYNFDATMGYYMFYGLPDGPTSGPNQALWFDFHRPQFVKNNDGSKMAFLYADDATSSSDAICTRPDLKGLYWDLEKNIMTGNLVTQDGKEYYEVDNFTSELDELKKGVNCLSLPKYGIDNGNSFEVPAFFVDMFSMEDITNGCTVLYLKGVTFTEADFIDADFGNLAPYDKKYPQLNLVANPDKNAGFLKGSGTYKAGTKVTIQALNSADATFLRWEKEDGTLVSEQASTEVTVNESITYKAVYDYKPTDGIKENNNKVDAQVYPNPATDKLSVSCEGMTDVQIFDITGKVLLDKKVTSSNEEINISSLPNGMMFIKIITANGYNVSKVVKK